MKIVVDATWDEEAQVWVAIARGNLGLITEAATIEELKRKLPVVASDLFEGDQDGPFETEFRFDA